MLHGNAPFAMLGWFYSLFAFLAMFLFPAFVLVRLLTT